MRQASGRRRARTRLRATARRPGPGAGPAGRCITLLLFCLSAAYNQGGAITTPEVAAKNQSESGRQVANLTGVAGTRPSWPPNSTNDRVTSEPSAGEEIESLLERFETGPSSSEEDSVISASEILTNPIVLLAENRTSARQTQAGGRVLFSSQHDEPTEMSPSLHFPPTTFNTSAQLADLFQQQSKRPTDQQELLASQELEAMGQQASRLLIQMLLLGLFILVSSSLIIIYAIKFCLCKRRKERRLLMRRALVADLPAGADLHNHHLSQLQQQQQQHHQTGTISTLARLPDSFLMNECTCHHHHNQQQQAGQQQHHLDCLSGLHYFPASTHSTAGASSSIQSYGNSMILALLQRLQQSFATCPSTPSTSSTATNASQQQQQLAELIVVQLQAQLAAASNCLQSTCLCQQHPLAATANGRPPAYHELFRVQQPHASPSAPLEQQTQQQREPTSSGLMETSPASASSLGAGPSHGGREEID